MRHGFWDWRELSRLYLKFPCDLGERHSTRRRREGEIDSRALRGATHRAPPCRQSPRCAAGNGPAGNGAAAPPLRYPGPSIAASSATAALAPPLLAVASSRTYRARAGAQVTALAAASARHAPAATVPNRSPSVLVATR
jgi:hypothetical protein